MKTETHSVENTMESHLHNCRVKTGETIRKIREKKGTIKNS
jgi:hypothetical protein